MIPMPHPQSALGERLNTWVSETLANRAIVAPFEETEQFCGRIRGLPSIAVMGASESEALTNLRNALVAYGNRLLALGQSLPRWDRPVIEVSDQVRRVVRLSTLRDLVKERCKGWGDGRQNLPAHALDPILADFDQIITRHAMNLGGGGNLLTH
jgi:predicted RNase H-like HicB family nuclease